MDDVKKDTALDKNNIKYYCDKVDIDTESLNAVVKDSVFVSLKDKTCYFKWKADAPK